MIINQKKKIKGSTVEVEWVHGSCPVVIMNSVSVREVRPGTKTSRWKKFNVSSSINHYNLKLKCFKEYEIAVVRWGTNRTFTQWRVKTGQGKN